MIDPNLKSVEGQIVSINYDKQGIAVRDKEGTVHPMYWFDGFRMLNWKGEQLKERWFIKLLAERNEKDDTWWVKDQQYFKKPADRTVQPKGEDKKYYGKSPEERKDIRLMACLKAVTEIFVSSKITQIEGMEYKMICNGVAQAAVEMERVLSGEVKG